jgi:hypothetical protein
VDPLEKVLERLGTTESMTLAFKREDDGKIRVGPVSMSAFEGKADIMRKRCNVRL